MGPSTSLCSRGPSVQTPRRDSPSPGEGRSAALRGLTDRKEVGCLRGAARSPTSFQRRVTRSGQPLLATRPSCLRGSAPRTTERSSRAVHNRASGSCSGERPEPGQAFFNAGHHPALSSAVWDKAVRSSHQMRRRGPSHRRRRPYQQRRRTLLLAPEAATATPTRTGTSR